MDKGSGRGLGGYICTKLLESFNTNNREKMNHRRAVLVHNAKSFSPDTDVFSTCNSVCLVGHGLFVAVFLFVVIEEEI